MSCTATDIGLFRMKSLFCFGMDAVLLSGFAKVKEGERVLDLGTGTGIIPILLAAKTKGKHFTGLEISKTSADMAQPECGPEWICQSGWISCCGDIKEAGEHVCSGFF